MDRQLADFALVESCINGDDFLSIIPASRSAVDVVPLARDGICFLAHAKTVQDLGSINSDAYTSTDFFVLRCLLIDVDLDAGAVLCERQGAC